MTAAINTAAVAAEGDREIRVERVFNASRERVWNAYGRVEQLAQWWGRGNRLDIERWEFRKGGHWRFVEHSDGETHGFEGRFREIVPQERIVQSFEWDGMPAHVAIDATTFLDLGDGRTKVVTVSQFHTPAERDGMLQSGMAEGLGQSYRALDELLAQSGAHQ
ncbi:SRPBCC family protein [Nocardia brevicatena]|uniref:SRPBCC family protein n=1 Tax=Nocardia brevicatena TaxID=37327 RepID=UPI000308744B|nr:SRPBCC family protein [Nocardia brevicatena]